MRGHTPESAAFFLIEKVLADGAPKLLIIAALTVILHELHERLPTRGPTYTSKSSCSSFGLKTPLNALSLNLNPKPLHVSHPLKLSS